MTTELTPEPPENILKGANPEITFELLDALIDANIRTYELEKVLFFRRLARGKEYTRTTVGELVGKDLRGKSVYAYYANYEDSEWEWAEEAERVIDTGDGTYQFGYSEQVERCFTYDCGHKDQDDCVEVPMAKIFIFHADTPAFVTWRKEDA